jgi:hypothetical protein
VAVKKRKEDFLILKTDTSDMDEDVKTVHLLIRGAILQEMGIRRPAVRIICYGQPGAMT